MPSRDKSLSGSGQRGDDDEGVEIVSLCRKSMNLEEKSMMYESKLWKNLWTFCMQNVDENLRGCYTHGN